MLSLDAFTSFDSSSNNNQKVSIITLVVSLPSRNKQTNKRTSEQVSITIRISERGDEVRERGKLLRHSKKN